MAMTACGMKGDISCRPIASPPDMPRLATSLPSAETMRTLGGRSGIDQVVTEGSLTPYQTTRPAVAMPPQRPITSVQ